LSSFSRIFVSVTRPFSSFAKIRGIRPGKACAITVRSNAALWNTSSTSSSVRTSNSRLPIAFQSSTELPNRTLSASPCESS
jgi:hypothetical protein